MKRHLLLPKENMLLVFKYTVVWNVANIRGPFRPLASHSRSVYTGQMQAKLVAPLGLPQCWQRLNLKKKLYNQELWSSVSFFFHEVQTGSGSHTTSYALWATTLSTVMQPGRESAHTSPCTPKVKNAWSYAFNSQMISCCGDQIRGVVQEGD